MKVQIQSQSIRLRIDESELARLLAGEPLENRTRIGELGCLSYMLQLHAAAEATVTGTPAALVFGLPQGAVLALRARLPCRDGLAFVIPAGAQVLQLQFDVDVRDSMRQRGVQRRRAAEATHTI